MGCKNISAGLFSAREHAMTFRESFKFYDKAEKIPRMIVNVRREGASLLFSPIRPRSTHHYQCDVT